MPSWSNGTAANSEVVVVEIVRTLVGSLGLVATVPFTDLDGGYCRQGGSSGHRRGLWPLADRSESRFGALGSGGSGRSLATLARDKRQAFGVAGYGETRGTMASTHLSSRTNVPSKHPEGLMVLA